MLKSTRFFLLCIAFFVVCPGLVYASGELSIQTLFSPTLKLTLSEKKRIHNTIIEAKQRLRYFQLLFKLSHRVRLVVIILNEDEYHDRYNAPVWSAALYRKDQILIKYPTEEKLSNKELMNLVSHEFIHSLIAHGAGSSCSHSMDEGIAMIFEKLSSYSMSTLVREIAIHAPKENISGGEVGASFATLFQRTSSADIEQLYDDTTKETLALVWRSLQGDESSIVALEQCLPNVRYFIGISNRPIAERSRLEGAQIRLSPSVLPSNSGDTVPTWHLKQAALRDDKRFVVLTPPQSLQR